MKQAIIILLSVLIVLSCTNTVRNKIVDKSELLGNDYRLFQNTPAWELAKAVEDGNESKINNILSENIKLVNYQESKYGETLLMLTIANQQYKSFKILLENKADVNIHNNYDGRSALIAACSYKQYDMKFVEELLKHGAIVNDIEVGKRRKGNSTRFTPLMAASKTGNLDLVKFLVEKGADVNYKNEYNQTALNKAMLVGRYNIVLYLLKSGADYNVPIFYREEEHKNMYIGDVLREDFLPLDSDEYKSKMEIISFLKNKGIDYRKLPIPAYIEKKAQEEYPDSWKEYLEKY